MTINQQQDAIIDEFADMDDWMDRYQLLIDMGNELEALDEKYKTNQNLIDGCQSRVWVQCDYRDGRLYFQADSDALIVKGIIALLIQVLSGHTPAEILDTDLYFIDRIGLRDHLSPTRSNGLLAMIKQIKAYALAYKTKGGHDAYHKHRAAVALLHPWVGADGRRAGRGVHQPAPVVCPAGSLRHRQRPDVTLHTSLRPEHDGTDV